jgi:hypothetical protein
MDFGCLIFLNSHYLLLYITYVTGKVSLNKYCNVTSNEFSKCICYQFITYFAIVIPYLPIIYIISTTFFNQWYKSVFWSHTVDCLKSVVYTRVDIIADMLQQHKELTPCTKVLPTKPTVAYAQVFTLFCKTLNFIILPCTIPTVLSPRAYILFLYRPIHYHLPSLAYLSEVVSWTSRFLMAILK